MKATLKITVEFNGSRASRARLIEVARNSYAEHPASDMTHATSNEDPGRPIPPEEEIADLQDAIMEFVQEALMEGLPNGVTYSGMIGPGPLDDEGRQALADELREAGLPAEPAYDTIENERDYGALARDLAAAYIGHRLGMSVARARKAHANDSEPVGLFWMALAVDVERRMRERVSEALSPQPATTGRPN